MTDVIKNKIQEICDELDCEAWTNIDEQGRFEVKIGWSSDKPLPGDIITGLTVALDISNDDNAIRTLEWAKRILKEKKEAVPTATQ